MAKLDELERAFDAYLAFLRMTLFLNRQEQLNKLPFPIEGKKAELFTLLQIAEAGPEFLTLVNETQIAFPIEDNVIPDAHYYEVQSFFRRSHYYLDFYDDREVNSELALSRFIHAFQRETIQVRYLVPIRSVDFSNESMAFSQFRLTRFTASELSELLETEANEIFYHGRNIDLSEIEGYWFLDLTHTEPSPKIDEIVIPDLTPSIRKEFTSLPRPIMNALQPFILFDWNAVARWESRTGWSSFDIPFVLELSDDLLNYPRWVPPIPPFYKEEQILDAGVEIDVPFYQIILNENEAADFYRFATTLEAILRRLSSAEGSAGFLEIGLGFLNKAFFSEGLQGLLWHMTSLEALLGEDREGLTTLLKKRLGSVLGRTEREAKEVRKTFDELYKLRSRLVHGDRSLLDHEVLVEHLGQARSFARRTMVWFLHYVDYIYRRCSENGHNENEFPTRAELLAALDLKLESRQRMRHLLRTLPEEFPNMPDWLPDN